MSLSETLSKWYDAKHKLEILEKKINKYKLLVSKEMQKQNTDILNSGGYSVSRRRNTRTYITKDSMPLELWKEYSTQCNYDSYFLIKK